MFTFFPYLKLVSSLRIPPSLELQSVVWQLFSLHIPHTSAPGSEWMLSLLSAASSGPLGFLQLNSFSFEVYFSNLSQLCYCPLIHWQLEFLIINLNPPVGILSDFDICIDESAKTLASRFLDFFLSAMTIFFTPLQPYTPLDPGLDPRPRHYQKRCHF